MQCVKLTAISALRVVQERKILESHQRFHRDQGDPDLPLVVRLLAGAGVAANVKPIVEIQQPGQRIKPKPSAPLGNPFGVVNARVFCDPADDFPVARTRRDEMLEFGGIDPRKIEKCAVKRTIVMIRSSATGEFSPAFVYRPRGEGSVRSERSPGTPRSNSRQVRSERLDSFVYIAQY